MLIITNFVRVAGHPDGTGESPAICTRAKLICSQPGFAGPAPADAERIEM
jgi:hypothetical protein